MRDQHADLQRVGMLPTFHPEKSGFRPEGCVIMNAKWVLPWMWQRRNTDLEFVMLVTCEWMLVLCGMEAELAVGHPVFELMEKHGAVFSVFIVSLSRSGLRMSILTMVWEGTFQTHLLVRLYLGSDEYESKPNSDLSALDINFTGGPPTFRLENSCDESAALHTDHTVLYGLIRPRVDPNFL